MTMEIEQMVIQYSIRDVIQIMLNNPVQNDLIGQINAVQVANRVSLAHLSIERAMKFLIEKNGGTWNPDHHLEKRLRELTNHDPESASFLREAFDAAVTHYRYNPKADETKHLRSLDAYFETTGSGEAFNKLRYWELEQALDDRYIRQVNPILHLEILNALEELLFESVPFGTVNIRVKRAVDDAMFPSVELAYSPGSAKERSVHSYMEWLSGFSSRIDALKAAVQVEFQIGDDLACRVTAEAYNALRNDADIAVSYLANTLDVLPRQQRDVIPKVEWIGEEKHRRGNVLTPAGTYLGLIQRGLDSLWYVTPARLGLMQVTAKAESQTDARSYLATLMAQEVEVEVGGIVRAMRLVGDEDRLLAINHDRSDQFEGLAAGDDIWTHKITFWQSPRGLRIGDSLRVRVPPRAPGGLVRLFVGEVLEIEGGEVQLSGADAFDVEGGEFSEQFFEFSE